MKKKKDKAQPIDSRFYINVPVVLVEYEYEGKPRFRASIALEPANAKGLTPVEAVQNLKNKIHGAF